MQQLAGIKGAIHIHSRYSDGSDGMEAIIGAARAAELDYVVVTDHNVLKAKSLGWEGWHDGVLVIVGCEISPKAGHCLALNVDNCRKFYKLPAPEYLGRVKAQGGMAFVAHPEGSMVREFNLKLNAWTYWDSPDYTGLEIWSYMHDWIRGCTIRRLRHYITQPDAHVSGPGREVLALWDRLAGTRRMVGIGSLDNHAANFPLRKCCWKLLKIFPHEFAFKTVRTHILVPPLTGRSQEDVDAVLAALKSGRCYIDYAPLGDGTGFRFTAEQNGQEYQMGDEMAAGGKPVTFRASCPRDAELSLLRDGQVEKVQVGRALEHSTAAAGVFRVEACIGGRAWVFSNHIYVRV
ncbi:MAG TPA: CehA/McbA family metallohydrolase [Planctomycetota bacterium]|nr:CehA/McbA family metallohydrolase [Planctomycetota bacterium]